MAIIKKFDDLSPDYKGKVTLTFNDASQFRCFMNNYFGTKAQDELLKIGNLSVEQLEHVIKSYNFFTDDTYSRAVHSLYSQLKLREEQGLSINQPRTSNGEMYRPLTFKENCIARIDDISLFETFLHSCTGVASKADSTLFKVKPECPELIIIPEGYSKSFLPVDYSSFDGFEVDRSMHSKKDMWLLSYGGINKENEEVYDAYSAKYIDFKEEKAGRKFNESEKEKLLENNFKTYTVENASEDQLRALCVYADNSYSYAFGYDILGSNARLLRVD
jgi:hypothetical protein